MQNRPRSSTRNDFDKVKDSLQKLKSENRKLRKENARLRKELSRVADVEFDKNLEEENQEITVVEPIEKKVLPECPKCHSHDYSEIPAGKYLIKACRSCGFRKRLQVKE
jgi:hypothetical protein